MNNFFDDDEAEKEYYIKIVTIFSSTSVALSFAMGYVNDRVPYKIMVPIVYILRALGAFVMTFAEKAEDWKTYVAIGLIFIANATSNVTTNSLLAKTVSGDIRGLIFGIYFCCGALGTMLIAKLGGYLYKTGWNYWPYAIVGAFDLVFCLFVVILVVTGKFKR